MTKTGYKLDYCSDHIRNLRRKFQEFQHGGIVMDSEQVQGIVDHLEEVLSMALNLEFAVSNAEWNKRAAAERGRMLNHSSVVVLDAFRNDPKVVPLFPSQGPQPPQDCA